MEMGTRRMPEWNLYLRRRRVRRRLREGRLEDGQLLQIYKIAISNKPAGGNSWEIHTC